MIEEGLAKNPNIRTPSVGALADAVGRAYGLEGDHLQWAKTPQQELAQRIAEAKPRVAAGKVAPIAVAADPFAAPPAGAFGPRPEYAEHGMNRAFGAVYEAELVPQGVPMDKPSWILPVVVGLLALVVGGAVTLAVMMGR